MMSLARYFNGITDEQLDELKRDQREQEHLRILKELIDDVNSKRTQFSSPDRIGCNGVR